MPPTTAPTMDSSVSTNPPQPRGNHLVTLPVELKMEIAKYLSPKDRINLRLFSRELKAMFAKDLFPGGLFTVRPQYDDMARLDAVSKHPELAGYITHLKVFVGDALREKVERAVILLCGNDIAARTKALAAIKPIYESEWSDLHHHCGGEMLQSLIPQLSNLTAISATSSCPFVGPLVITVTGRMVDFARYWTPVPEFSGLPGSGDRWIDVNMSIARYEGILHAAKHTRLKLMKLDLEALPSDCLIFVNGARHNPIHLRNEAALRALVRELRDLRIGITTPRQYLGPLEMGKVHRLFFGLMPKLRRLDLVCYPTNYKAPDFTTIFRNIKWPHLETLRLSRTRAPPRMVLDFLRKHTSTLRCLHLSDWALHDGYVGFGYAEPWTHQSFLDEVKRDLNLKKLQYLLGNAPYNPYGEEKIYADDWTAISENSTHPSEPVQPIRNAKLLEMYVLRKIAWPMEFNLSVCAQGLKRQGRASILLGLTDQATPEDRELLSQLRDDDDDDADINETEGYGMPLQSE